MSLQFNQEKAKRTIRQALDRMKTEADPHLLNEYRALFKKEVSLFRRSWAAAYLLMLCDQGGTGAAGTGKFDRGRSRRPGDSGRTPDRSDRPGRPAERTFRNRPDEGENRAERGPYPLADEDSRRLFFSIGRNRRVFPREILGFITSRTDIPREDIGAIRILDNYSFVQVRDTAADTIIEALNGQPFRGRTLTVSYARARREDGGGFDTGAENEERTVFETAAEGRHEPEDRAREEAAENRDDGFPADNGGGADSGFPADDNGSVDGGFPADDNGGADDGFPEDDGGGADEDAFTDEDAAEKAGLSEQGENQPDKEEV
jgi:hypothetical protein